MTFPKTIWKSSNGGSVVFVSGNPVDTPVISVGEVNVPDVAFDFLFSKRSSALFTSLTSSPIVCLSAFATSFENLTNPVVASVKKLVRLPKNCINGSPSLVNEAKASAKSFTDLVRP
jgi:hypothetical protein